MSTVRLTLPLPPNVANGRFMGHWSARCRQLGQWKERAVVLGTGIRGRHRPMQRATLSVVMYVGGGRMDDDNAVARLKPAIDLLKERGLIVDDRRPYLTLLGIPEQRTSSPRRVELTLTEVDAS